MPVDSQHSRSTRPRVAPGDSSSGENLDRDEIAALRSRLNQEQAEHRFAEELDLGEAIDPSETRADLDRRTQELRTSVDRALAGLDALAAAPRPYRPAALQASQQPASGWFAPHEELTVRVVFGTVALDHGTAAHLRTGSVVALDQLDGEPVDIYVNDWLAARGELQVWEGKFAVRIVERMEPEEGATSR